jgi:hypothetical protein
MTKTTYNKLETRLTCKIDKNGRTHVYKAREEPKKVSIGETLSFALFLAAAILILIF